MASAVSHSSRLRPAYAALAAFLTLFVAAAAEPLRAARVKADRTNVRARPSYDGEVLASLRRGSAVNVIAEVEGAEGEPGGGRKWAKIQLPAEVAVWVYAPLLDAKTHQVKGEVLKFRAGPGRNYSELGELKRGEVITEIRQADDWIQIEPPAQATAFVAASLLETAEIAVSTQPPPLEVVPVPDPAPQIVPATQSPPPLLRSTAPESKSARPESRPETVAIPEGRSTEIAAPTPADPAPPAVVPAATPSDSPAPTIEPIAPAAEVPAARAVVREGVVRRTNKLQAPGLFELRSARRGDGLFSRDEGLLDFLIVENPEIKLDRFENRRVFVHGTEWRDERWRTPVLKIERIDTAAY